MKEVSITCLVWELFWMNALSSRSLRYSILLLCLSCALVFLIVLYLQPHCPTKALFNTAKLANDICSINKLQIFNRVFLGKMSSSSKLAPEEREAPRAGKMM